MFRRTSGALGAPPTTADTAPTRRSVLLGIGALATAPLVVGAGSSPATAAAAKPECLADLIAMGVVDRGDLVAG